MSRSILDLPDDVLVELFTRYVIEGDLKRLKQVCRRFYSILHQYPQPWRTALMRKTNVSFSYLKNSISCPVVENAQQSTSTISHPLFLPDDFRYEVLSERSDNLPSILSDDFRRPFDSRQRCSKVNCDFYRLSENYPSLLTLTDRWIRPKYSINSEIVRFSRRSQVSMLQYDEHSHHLWFNYNRALSCLDLVSNTIIQDYQLHPADEVFCYKVYNDQCICIANGSRLRILSRPTNQIVQCENNFQPTNSSNESNYILCLDVYSNDKERYVIVNGGRQHTVSVRTFDLSSQSIDPIWQTRVDDRVLCTRFTSDGHHFLIGTGGTANVYPLILFNTERAQPMHLYNAQYRRGAGVRCIEWASTNVFLAAGFDNQLKEFDLRTGQCHFTYNDEYGNDYSSMFVSSDYRNVSNGIILGCNHHSTIRIFNRRQQRSESVIFVSDQSSPVHSIAATPEYIFASVDRSIVALDFTRSKRFQSIHYRF